MTPAEREAFYDAEIAPVLAAVGKKCQERGMGFLALVDYTGIGNIGETATFPAGAPAVLRYAHGISQADNGQGSVNIDSFMFAVMKDARQTGHSSIVLQQLGVPVKPAAAA